MQVGATTRRSFVAKTDERSTRRVLDEEDEPFSADQMWENYAYFMNAVLPVAEEAGVKLALHPDDPPVPMLGGVATPLPQCRRVQEGREIAKSPAWGLDLCLGCCSEMPGGAAQRDAR